MPYPRPLPSTFNFCLPTKATIVPHTPDWLHEIKYDGYRLRVERDCDRVRLASHSSPANAEVRGHGVLAHASRSSLSLSMQLSRTRSSWMVDSSSCLFWWVSFTALISLSMTVDDPFCRLRYSAISSLALRLASLTTSSNCVVIFLAPPSYGGFDATTCSASLIGSPRPVLDPQHRR